MRNPPPRITGSGGAGLTLVTWVADKVLPSGLPRPLLYVLLAVGLAGLLWAAASGFVQAIKHTRTEGTSILPVIGMAVTAGLFVLFAGWYYVENYMGTAVLAQTSSNLANLNKGGDSYGSGGAGGGGSALGGGGGGEAAPGGAVGIGGGGKGAPGRVRRAGRNHLAVGN
jgi:hypothetical protein